MNIEITFWKLKRNIQQKNESPSTPSNNIKYISIVFTEWSGKSKRWVCEFLNFLKIQNYKGNEYEGEPWCLSEAAIEGYVRDSNLSSDSWELFWKVVLAYIYQGSIKIGTFWAAQKKFPYSYEYTLKKLNGSKFFLLIMSVLNLIIFMDLKL